MGLCKCSKRKVTNLFCFVHRVNVCEECMLSEHSRCTVQSYLKWLEDSDYSNDCVLCAQSILQGPVVRLTCYDLFHEYCLQSYMNSSSQAHNCPKCKEMIMPPSHFASPVADQVRHSLQTITQRTIPITSQRTIPNTSQRTISNTSQSTILNTSQKIFPSSSYDSKYRSKVWNPRQWLRDERAARVLDESMSRFLCVVGLIVCLTVLLILVLTRVGREVAKQDATLDWNFNPHIKTGN